MVSNQQYYAAANAGSWVKQRNEIPEAGNRNNQNPNEKIRQQFREDIVVHETGKYSQKGKEHVQWKTADRLYRAAMEYWP